MSSILVRNVDDRTKSRLRVLAAEHGRSMEEEVREVLKAHVRTKKVAQPKLADAIRGYFAPMGGWDIELPPRLPMREPPDFSGSEYDR